MFWITIKCRLAPPAFLRTWGFTPVSCHVVFMELLKWGILNEMSIHIARCDKSGNLMTVCADTIKEWSSGLDKWNHNTHNANSQGISENSNINYSCLLVFMELLTFVQWMHVFITSMLQSAKEVLHMPQYSMPPEAILRTSILHNAQWHPRQFWDPTEIRTSLLRVFLSDVLI